MTFNQTPDRSIRPPWIDAPVQGVRAADRTRRALTAHRPRLVAPTGMNVLAGLCIGSTAALLGSRAMTSLLFGVSPGSQVSLTREASATPARHRACPHRRER
jgi:hypothetical protein